MNLSKLENYIYSRHRMLFNRVNFKNLDLSKFIYQDLKISEFNQNDLAALENTLEKCEYQSDFDAADVIKRIENGNELYVAKDKSDIVGFTWIAIDSTWIPYFDATIKLSKDEFYLFNAYVQREYRGRGIYGKIKAFVYEKKKTEGYNKQVGFIHDWNKSSLRANKKLHSEIIGEVEWWYILTLMYRINRVSTNEIIFHGNSFNAWRKLIGKF